MEQSPSDIPLVRRRVYSESDASTPGAPVAQVPQDERRVEAKEGADVEGLTPEPEAAGNATPSIDTHTIPSRGEHKATIVFLHGLGDTGRGVLGFFRPQGFNHSKFPHLLQHPNLKWVFPTAPRQRVSCNGGLVIPSWFDVFQLQEGAEEDNEGIDKAAKLIARILEDERQAAPRVKLVLGGISQGGALALHLTTRKFAGTYLDGTDASSVPMDGTVCLCGWLIAEDKLASMKYAKEAEKHPIIYCHGREDWTVAFDWGRNSADALRSLGFSSLKYMSYEGLGHTTSPGELEDVKRWIECRWERPRFRWAWPCLKEAVENVNGERNA